MTNDDLFPVEFRHEQVTKFVRGLIEGTITLKGYTTRLEPQLRDAVIKSHSELITDITNYVSGKLRREELDALEQKLFQWLAIMKITDGIEEKITESQMEREIRALQLRIDSTNTLLLEVMTILKEFMKSFDEK